MLAKLTQSPTDLTGSRLDRVSHLLVVLPAQQPETYPAQAILKAKLKRRSGKYADLAKSPLTADLPQGGLVSWLVLDERRSRFERDALLCKALQPLLEEQPETLTIAVLGDPAQRLQAAEAALYVARVNSAHLPSRKQKDTRRRLKQIALYGCRQEDAFPRARARAAGNTLARSLTALPPNDLTPAVYRGILAGMAQEQGWGHEEYDVERLRKLGAGAFVAVAQGSDPQDAAIVHLSYAPKKARKTIALAGKGICFDTGGHNLKPARYMHGMHEDMNGSAVALGILLAATQLKMPVRIDCWLAIAQNHISARAYKQNDVVTALNGNTIEIVQTDAEGRMVLADTLTLASRARPDLLIDFATLTGSMITALGNRISGVIGNTPELLCQAVGAGRDSGERICVFPFEEDYDRELESKIADIKQCTLDSDADHMLAARFLSRFIEHDTPWLHVDLSACNCKGGLGAVASDVTGFGVGWCLSFLQAYLENTRHGTAT